MKPRISDTQAGMHFNKNPMFDNPNPKFRNETMVPFKRDPRVTANCERVLK